MRRLLEALSLADRELIAALGGRRREQLLARYERWTVPARTQAAMCRHSPGWPRTAAAAGASAPQMLHLSCSPACLTETLSRPRVALLGASAASDYGCTVTRSLARHLSIAGVTVVAALRDGIASAAHEGALEAQRPSLAVLDHGLGRHAPASLRVLRRRLLASGCLLAELPGDTEGRCWGARACDRTLASFASAAVLVEDSDDGAATFALSLARERVPVGAVPGAITSWLSTGPHAALTAGARLIARAEDVLEMLAEDGDGAVGEDAGEWAGCGAATRREQAAQPARGLPARLQRMLERIGAGYDTPEAITVERSQQGETFAALAELELLGLVSRTAAGRYLAREPAGRVQAGYLGEPGEAGPAARQ